MSAPFPFPRAICALLAFGLMGIAASANEAAARKAPPPRAAHAAAARAASARARADSARLARPAGPDSLRPERILDWPVPLDTIQVRARRPTRAQVLARESAFCSWIEVAASREAGESLGHLLARATGLRVSRLGGPGTPATVSIRGAAAGEIEVYLDRVPLRSASHGIVDLNAIDLGQIAAIEVYRSAPPTDLGGQASSAAVRLVTRRDGGPGASLRAMSGSHGTREMTETFSIRQGHLNLFASLARFSTKGDVAYASDNGTPYEPADDARLAWGNGDQLRQTLFAQWRLGGHRDAFLEGSSQLVRRDQGVPGTRQTPTERVRFQTSAALHRLELSTGTRWHPLRANVYGFAETSAQSYRDPLRELSVFGLPKEIDQDQDRASAGGHLRWLAPGHLGGTHSVEGLAEIGAEHLVQQPPPGRPREDRRVRRTLALSLGDHWETLAGHLRLSAFLRWDRSADNYSGADPYRPFAARPEHVSAVTSPRLGGRATLGRGHTLKANYARQSRFPTFTELFGCEGTLRANATLRPETGWRADCGWIWEPASRPLGLELRAEQALYTSRLDDMIVFVLVSDHETKPFNLDRSRIDGAEFAFSAAHLPGLRDLDLVAALTSPWRAQAARSRDAPAAGEQALGSAEAQAEPEAEGSRDARRNTDAGCALRLEWQDARDEGASPVYHGKRLPYHPALQAQANVDLVQGRWMLGYTAVFRSAAYWGRSNLEMFRTPEQWRHDLALRCRLIDGRLALGLRIENLADRELEDIRGYPLPGRSWFGEIEWHWAPPADGRAADRRLAGRTSPAVE